MTTVPTIPWATPAFAGLLESPEVRKSTPRSWKTGIAFTSWSTTRTMRVAREKSRARMRMTWRMIPVQSRCWARRDPLTTIAAAGWLAIVRS